MTADGRERWWSVLVHRPPVAESLGPELGPTHLLGTSHGSVACLGSLGIGEGAISCPQPQTERQGLPVLAHLLACVDVEELHRFQQLTAASDKGLVHLGSGDLLIHDESDVFLGHRVGGEPPNGTAIRGSSNQRVEIQLDCAGASW